MDPGGGSDLETALCIVSCLNKNNESSFVIYKWKLLEKFKAYLKVVLPMQCFQN